MQAAKVLDLPVPTSQKLHQRTPFGRAFTSYFSSMFWITITFAFAAAAATLYFLIRGLVAFLKTTAAALDADGAPAMAHAQNKAMQGRVGMQALAVVFALLALLLFSS